MRFGFVLPILLVVGGCGYKDVDVDEMVVSMEEARLGLRPGPARWTGGGR